MGYGKVCVVARGLGVCVCEMAARQDAAPVQQPDVELGTGSVQRSGKPDVSSME